MAELLGAELLGAERPVLLHAGIGTLPFLDRLMAPR